MVAPSKERPGATILPVCVASWSIATRAKVPANTSTSFCCLPTWPVEAVHQAVSLCVKRRAFSDEAVESVLSYQPPSLSTTLDLSDRPLLQMESTGIRPANEYDVLLQEEDLS